MPDLAGVFRKSKKTEKKAEAEAEQANESGKTFLKAVPLRDLSDLDSVKSEVSSGKILIVRITPLADKSIEDVKHAVDELCGFVESIGGDIARLGEERIVVCPPNVKIWRDPALVPSEPVPTAT